MKNNITILIAVTAFLMAGCKTSQKTAPVNGNQYSDSLSMALNNFAKKSLIPGFAVAIVSDKDMLYSKGFGLADIENNKAFTTSTINWVASISKTFVALSIMKLVEDNKLSLDDPINSILPYTINNPITPMYR